MIPAYTHDMNQTATYWAPGENNGFGGVDYDAPIVITCRWQDKVELLRSSDGRQVASSAVVYVDRPLVVQGWLALGDLRDTAGGPIPTDVGARTILQVGSSPDLDLEDTLHKVWL